MSDRLDDIINFRKEKLARFEARGLAGYPSVTERTHTVRAVLDSFENFSDTDTVTIVGRIRSLRTMGKLVFAHVEDGTGKIQVLLKTDIVGEDALDFFASNFDIGDFAQFTGTLFVTKTGEKTVQAGNYKLLAKSLRPLPSDYYGLEDEETRLRKRYLDILLNPEVKEVFVKKAKFWKAMREFLERKGFLEMNMPVLEPIPGGAETEPFITHHNALDRDFFLRISLELPLKKMLVAGYEKVYEIGRIFRNEGIDTTHLQDYMQMEFYWAYGDFEKMLSMLEEMYQYIIEQTFGTLRITSDGKIVDWSGVWKRVRYTDLFKEHTGISLETATDEELRAYADTQSIVYEDFVRRGRLIDLIFKKIRKNLPTDKPIFLIDQPIELEPLAKRVPGHPHLVQRAQIIAYGTELGKGFGELNDPIDQRARFDEQMKLREGGDKEAQMIDEDYVEAMEYGMPPAAGFGLSERLFAVLADKPIRETVLFPPMRDQHSNESKKSKDTKIVVAVINAGIGMQSWQELNTIAHLNAAFGAHVGKSLFLQDDIETSDGEKIKLNIQHAIMIQQAKTSAELLRLAREAKEKGLEVSEFTREMIETTDDRKVIDWTKSKSIRDVDFFGVLLFGPKSIVEQLTKEFPLYGKDSASLNSSVPENSVPVDTSTEEVQSLSSRVPSREEALALLHTHVHTPNLIKHMLATESFMRALAEKFGGDPHTWGIAGLLHDLDWDQTKDNPEQHSLIAYDMLMQMGFDPEMCQAIKVHNDRHGIAPVTMLDKALLLEVYTGFITACALVQPDKKLSSVTIESAMKKFKTKSFAAGANRDLMARSQELVGMSVEEVLQLCLESMQKISAELGL